MRLRGRQGRFVALTLAGWVGARAWLLWPTILSPIAEAAHVATVAATSPAAVTGVTEPVAPRPRHPGAPAALPARADAPVLAANDRPADRPPFEPADVMAAPAAPAEIQDRPFPQAIAPGASPARRFEASAYVFVRPGSGKAGLAPGGMLGSSQMAARLAYALDDDGPVRFAVAGRIYTPLHGKGAETAVGLDWHPRPAIPLRVSIERRIRLDRAGRNAWSAYAAGGFYRSGLPLGLEADGYAQAGIVGAAARDPFADGSLRLGYPVPLAGRRLIAGAGLWGAAQPHASRLDAGPRASLTLPLVDHALTVALEGRLRVAGRAAPGSGAALTIAADF